MTTTINADNVTGGAIVTGDASGQLGLQAAGVTKLTVSSSGVTLATPLPVASGGTGGSATPTAGGIVYGTGTVQAVTAAGTSGQYLQSNAGSAPTWVTASSGALVYLSTVTASSSATVDVETTFSSTYSAYLIIGTDIFCATSAIFNCRLKIGGSYLAGSAYGYHRHDLSASSTAYEAVAASGGSEIPLTGAMSTARSANFVMTVYIPSDTTSEKKVDWRFAPGRLQNNNSTGAVGSASNSGTSALTGVRFFFATGNVASGEFRLYGIANS